MGDLLASGPSWNFSSPWCTKAPRNGAGQAALPKLTGGAAPCLGFPEQNPTDLPGDSHPEHQFQLSLVDFPRQ